MTNWKNKKLAEEGKLPPLPKKASPAPPKKDYPVFAHDSSHDHPYAIAANRIHALEKTVRELSAENSSLRKLALHGLIYRLDHLIAMERVKGYPNLVRIRRWTEERTRITFAYERLKGSKG